VTIHLIGGCDEGLHIEDQSFSLIDSVTVQSIEPASYSQGGISKITLLCGMRYPGRGSILINSLGGAGIVGNLRSPIEGPVGAQLFTIDFPAGEFEVPVEIEMTTTLERCAFSVIVSCDSLYVNGAMVYWLSEEGYNVFRRDLPEDTAFIENRAYQQIAMLGLVRL
jgi:hypothetical protein